MGTTGEVDGWRLHVPAAYDALWTVTVVLLVGLTVAALVVWARRRETAVHALGALALIVLVPGLGPAAYLAGVLVERRPGRRAGTPERG